MAYRKSESWRGGNLGVSSGVENNMLARSGVAAGSLAFSARVRENKLAAGLAAARRIGGVMRAMAGVSGVMKVAIMKAYREG
jgi:hypothetical protein